MAKRLLSFVLYFILFLVMVSCVCAEYHDDIAYLKGYSYNLMPNYLYPDNEMHEMTNGVIEREDIGWRYPPGDIEITFDLEQEYDLAGIEAYFHRDHPVGVYIPSYVNILVSEDNQRWVSPLGRIPIKDHGEGWYNLYFPSDYRGRYVKVDVSSGGEWTMINEIRVMKSQEFQSGDLTDDFSYKQDYNISDVYNVDHTNEPVILAIDSQKLIVEGKLNPDCSDIRILDSTSMIDSINMTGCGSASTKIIFPYSLSAGMSKVISLYYGCPNCLPPREYTPLWIKIPYSINDVTDPSDACWASSTYPRYSPNNIVDNVIGCGKETCMWAPDEGYGSKEWIACDLGEEHLLSAVRFTPNPFGDVNDGWEDYDIFLSKDNISWTKAVDGRNLPDSAGWSDDQFMPQEARYFRFEINDSHWIYLHEVEFYSPLSLKAEQIGAENRVHSAKPLYINLKYSDIMGGAALGFGIVAGIFFVVLLFIALSIFMLVFWLWMLVHCIKHKFKDENNKVIWVLLMIFTGIIASIVYYFAVYRESNKRKS